MPFDPKSLAAPGVRTLAPYVPGKPIEELEREYGVRDSIKLASNENPLGPGPRALQAIAEAARSIGLYPDGGGFALKQALAQEAWLRRRVHHARQRLERCARDDRRGVSDAGERSGVLAVRLRRVSDRGSGDRADSARRAGAIPPDHAMPLGHDLDAMARLVNDTHAGRLHRQSEQSDRDVASSARRCSSSLLRCRAQTLVVIDEAYIEYVEDPEFPDASRWLAAIIRI